MVEPPLNSNSSPMPWKKPLICCSTARSQRSVEEGVEMLLSASESKTCQASYRAEPSIP